MKINNALMAITLEQRDSLWFGLFIATVCVVKKGNSTKSIQAQVAVVGPAISKWLLNNLQINYTNGEIRYVNNCVKSLLANQILKHYGAEDAADKLEKLFQNFSKMLIMKSPGHRTPDRNDSLTFAADMLVYTLNRIVKVNDPIEAGICAALGNELTLVIGSDAAVTFPPGFLEMKLAGQ